MDQPSNVPSPKPPVRPIEQQAVLTTIVGSRPPGSGQPIGQVPRGLEVLVKKAAVDAEFKRLLLTNRAQAAQEIGLQLEPAEALMLGAVPAQQLELIIARTTVPEEHRRTFLGQAAAAMLATMGVTLPGCGPTPVRGVESDRPEDNPPLPPQEVPTKGHDAKRPPQKEKSQSQDK